MKWIVLVLAGVLAALAAALAIGHWRWRTLTQELNAKVDGARAPGSPARFDPSDLRALPAPVQRYLAAAIAEGTSLLAAASMAHSGDFNMGETVDQWRPFHSTQRVVMRRPGFVWDGRISMFPGLSVHVHDAYVEGEGILHAAIGGVVDVANLRGRDDLSQGELLRFLAETAWYPTALLPGQGVRWDPLDDRSARATLTEGQHSATLTFVFNVEGLIESVRAEARGRLVRGVSVPTPWEGRWSDYEWRNGLRVPTRGEVAWLLPEGPKPYWRGRLSSLTYQFAPL